MENIEDGVIVPLSGPEKGSVHSLNKEKEVDKLFSSCREYTMERKASECLIKATACGSH